ncbi:MAG TPA: gamma-glutamyltransferase [Caulobacteraceae bacterium]
MRILLAFLLTLSVSACATTPPPPQRSQAFVAAANPLAAEAGMKVLREGGSAVDAAVAVQAVLGLVEPQSSGLGGGAFMLYRDAASGKITAYNGRETAPAGASADMFIGPDGKPMPFMTAVLSGRSTGVPGAMAMLGLAQKEHGDRAWSSLFDEAIRLADEGFVVSPRLAGMIAYDVPAGHTADAERYFMKAPGRRYGAGDVLRNPAYARTLREMAGAGVEALYEGPLADAIAAKTHEPPIPGPLSAADLKAYRAKASEPLCRPYRIYVVCVPPPPSSGVALLQALMMLEHTDIDQRGPNDPAAWAEFAEAQRLMYADRDRYVGDPDFVTVPVRALLDPAYVAARAEGITDRAAPSPSAGVLPLAFAPDATNEAAGTSHFVIVDHEGNVVSMTTTVESVFGSGRMAGGFFLNNQLTDFSFSPAEADGAPAANAVAPGKRPRSSMTPIIVTDRQGRFVAALGSPGGSSILAYNLKTLIGVLDWGLTMDEAIELPNFMARGDVFIGEPDRFDGRVLRGLADRGYVLKDSGAEVSGIQGVIVRPGGFEGGADSRREGVVLTEP